MNDPRRPEWFSPPLAGSGPAAPQGPQSSPPVDPAYAGQAPYAPTYGGGYSPQWTQNPTDQLPAYWQQGQTPPGETPTEILGPPPPQGPKTPRWLLIGAGVAVLLVVALVIALVLANGAVKNQTAVPPLPAMPGSSPETTTPTTRTSPRSHYPLPPPTVSTAPTETTGPAVMQSVVYDVSGDGRAISITYWDTGDVIQTEFNVALPWSKQVSLSKSAAHPASVTIINIGHNVTCTLTVDGVQVRQRVGAGITICDAGH
ncbi:MmpS family transport accessory protein [Mycobacterium sp. 663a-19]|uniref:MmpS family transport accessory protein n=1 Tax=Mycobacterium sp. 663a-19 TaxID=2986148 RepID=UPI002D1F412E|nr:MmpS family transport accessory protein [Mycobacterium sp. 663a-19]MEB3980982.1 MmpS family transport accessory protein [Mycobacterium sp. 663a-19]